MACHPSSHQRAAWCVTTSILSILFLGPTTGPGFEPNLRVQRETVAQQNVIRASKETTRITSPLDAEGYVDYLQAINDQYSEGVTRQNNFEVVVRAVMALDGIPEEMHAEYFTRIGIPAPGKNAHAYRDFISFTLDGNEDQKEYDRILEEHGIVTSQPWKAAEHPEAAKWVAEYGKDLDRLVEGSKRARFYTPYLVSEPETDEPIPRLIAVLLPSIQQQREIARALSIRAMGRVEKGNLEGAWSDLQAMRRVSRHVGRGFTLVEGLVAIGISSIAFQAEVQLFNSPRLTDEQARRFLDDLSSLPPLPPIADKIDVGERYMGLDTVLTLARYSDAGGLFKMLNVIQALSDATHQRSSLSLVSAQQQSGTLVNSAIDWNATLVLMNEWYDRLVAASREPDFKQRKARFETINRDIKKLAAESTNAQQLLKLLMTKGSRKAMGAKIGGVLVALLLPAVDAARVAEDQATAQNAVITLGFAVELYRRSNGSLPESLDRLATRYVRTIADDPFSGTALNYAVKDGGFLLYSVGRNGIDDKGLTYKDAAREKGTRPSWDDIVVRVRQ